MDVQEFNIRLYRFRASLGSGAQAQVKSFKLKKRKRSSSDLSLPNRVALKLFNKDKDFHEEYDFYTKIQHVNIVKVYGHCEHEGTKCLVMEEYDFDLERFMVHSRGKDSLSHDEAMCILSQVANGLAHMDSILHRDLKPKNILVRKTNEGSIQVRINFN